MLKAVWVDGIGPDDYGKAVAMLIALGNAVTQFDERRIEPAPERRRDEPEEPRSKAKWESAVRLPRRESGQQGDEP